MGYREGQKKIFKGIASGTVEKRFIGVGVNPPRGWYTSAAEAIRNYRPRRKKPEKTQPQQPQE